MPDDAPRHLETLTISKLKAVAKRFGVDISSCRQKKDYVRRLAESGITESDVVEALTSSETNASAPAEKATEDIKHEIEDIAERSSGRKVLPAADDEEVERYIDRVLLVRPSFFEIDSQVETVWNHMIMADYHDALILNSEVRSKMLDRFSTFQVFSCALALRAAESILTSLADARGGHDPALKTALAEAKRAFIDGSPRHREETLETLESLTSKAYDAFFEGSTRAEAELRTLLSDYESFGTQTQDAWKLLDIAEQARQSFNVAEYAKILDEATNAASSARKARASEIDKAFGVVRSAMHEAREVGATLSVGEKEMEQAREAFEKQAFKKAVDLLASIEQVADSAHRERLRDNDVRTRQFGRVSQTIEGLEKTLEEAASYGMDVQEGLLFVGKARDALGNRDLVSAAKLARHAKDQTTHIGTGLDRERLDRGVAKKVDEARCGKCGKEALYSFPNDVQKCIECGHSFSMIATPSTPTRSHLESPVSASHPDGGKDEQVAPAADDEPRKRRPLLRTLKKY